MYFDYLYLQSRFISFGQAINLLFRCNLNLPLIHFESCTLHCIKTCVLWIKIQYIQELVGPFCEYVFSTDKLFYYKFSVVMQIKSLTKFPPIWFHWNRYGPKRCNRHYVTQTVK